MDCGPTCLRMVAHHYGKTYPLQTLREHTHSTRDGASLLGISEAAKAIGMNAVAVRLPFNKLEHIPLPCIAHWKKHHFIVIYKVKKQKIYIADPAYGLITYSKKEFLRGWQKQEQEGYLLLLEPTPTFYQEKEQTPTTVVNLKYLASYLNLHKANLFWVLLTMLLATLLQFLLPFLTQAVVDTGIENRDLNFVYLVLLGQFGLYIGQTIATFIRSRILLHIGTRINITIISDFLTKLMKLPLSFFDTKVIGDILQRIQDHYRIESFVTTVILSMLMAVVQTIAFSAALIAQSNQIFVIFTIGSFLYLLWVIIFMKKRREIDYKRFDQLANHQGTLIQLIHGMPELKLNNAEEKKRWEWQRIQEKLYEINIGNLVLDQYQQGGSAFINQFKNILIAFLAARAVILGQMTLGEMMAIQLIVGQLSTPIMQSINFIRMAQDARISMERLGEVHNLPEEDSGTAKLTHWPTDQSLYVRHLQFQYEGPFSPYVFEDISLDIPIGKVTAVVGPSGSGKTTLMKLLLKFYEPTAGNIYLGPTNLFQFDTKQWRQQCGVVMQDGYLFADTIANNIALSDEEVNEDKLLQAMSIANIQEFVAGLPLGYETKIGPDGHQLSRGQRQRILIARAIYKDPNYLFFDEATNALDATNERQIMDNLEELFQGRTVIVIAHRLSTVKKADQIVVLDKGRILEQGTHQELIMQAGAYHQLVQDQLS